MRMSKRSQPNLFFGPGDLSGFTSVGIAGFHDLKPAAIVRELMQNSLDAAREAKRKVVKIKFVLERHSLQDIPGLQAYEKAFHKAVKGQTEKQTLPDYAKAVVDVMDAYLKKKKCDTLYILDNGIGLDERRMNGLLADGISVKSESGTGAVGNGHMVPVPSSDLRYVLYGGKQVRGSRIAAGHAVLASHESQGMMKSKDGFFVKEIRSRLQDPYTFAKDQEIPPYISKKLDWIEQNWKPGAGTVVAIPAFNYFRESKEKSLWDMISQAAACNFFAAFKEGELSIELQEGNRTYKLNKNKIYATLQKFSTEKRTSSGFLSGAAALGAYEAISNGEKLLVSTSLGTVTVCVLPTENSPSRIDLCRNGMWITDKLPQLAKNKFASREPFRAVILLDVEAEELHRIVRKAEGPLHNSIERQKWLSKDEKKHMNAAFKQIGEAIRSHLPELSDERFKVGGILQIGGGVASGGRREYGGGDFEPVPPQIPPSTDDKEKQPGLHSGSGGNGQGDGSDSGDVPNRGGKFIRHGRTMQFSAIPVPKGSRRWNVSISPGEVAQDSELRFILDENVDESSNESGTNIFMQLDKIKINNQSVSPEQLVKDENKKVRGIRLGALALGQVLEVDLECISESESVRDTTHMVLKTQLVHRKPEQDSLPEEKKSDGKK